MKLLPDYYIYYYCGQLVWFYPENYIRLSNLGELYVDLSRLTKVGGFIFKIRLK